MVVHLFNVLLYHYKGQLFAINKLFMEDAKNPFRVSTLININKMKGATKFMIPLVTICLLAVACQKDSLTDTMPSDNPSQIKPQDEISQGYLPVPEKYREDPAAFAQQMLDETGSAKETSGENCVWIDFLGLAHLEPDCTINNQIPDKKGCDRVSVKTGDCYVSFSTPWCSYCEVVVVVECDDGLWWRKDWILVC